MEARPKPLNDFQPHRDLKGHLLPALAFLFYSFTTRVNSMSPPISQRRKLRLGGAK